MKKKTIVQRILNAFGHPFFITKKGIVFSFARADESDAKRIHRMSDDKLLNASISLQYCMVFSGVSLCDIQIQELYGLELHQRKLMDKARREWNKIKDFHCNSCGETTIDSYFCEGCPPVSCYDLQQ